MTKKNINYLQIDFSQRRKFSSIPKNAPQNLQITPTKLNLKHFPKTREICNLKKECKAIRTSPLLVRGINKVSELGYEIYQIKLC